MKKNFILYWRRSLLVEVDSSETPAEELKKRTRFLCDEVIAKELEEEQKGKSPIYGF